MNELLKMCSCSVSLFPTTDEQAQALIDRATTLGVRFYGGSTYEIEDGTATFKVSNGAVGHCAINVHHPVKPKEPANG